MRGSIGLRRKGGSRFGGQEDVNPMEGAINIVDAMLVFACGLMLSLVIYWNVDIQNKELVPAVPGEEVEEISGEDVSSNSTDLAEGGLYEKMGTVYVDPATGKMYLVNEEDPDSSDSSAE